MRTTRNRWSFRLESLEIRNAPSHFGALAHAAIAVHTVHAAAHVRSFSDSSAHDKASSVDRNSGVEQSPDNSVETGSGDHSGPDTNPKDHSSIDSAGQS